MTTLPERSRLIKMITEALQQLDIPRLRTTLRFVRYLQRKDIKNIEEDQDGE